MAKVVGGGCRLYFLDPGLKIGTKQTTLNHGFALYVPCNGNYFYSGSLAYPRRITNIPAEPLILIGPQLHPPKAQRLPPT